MGKKEMKKLTIFHRDGTAPKHDKKLLKTYQDILGRLNAVLVVKHGEEFNIDGKAPPWDWCIKKIDDMLSQHKVMLKTLKMAYQKHCIGADTIGWSELDNKLLNCLCEVMGDEEFQKWEKKP